MGLPSPKNSAVVGNCGGFLGSIWFGCDYVCIPGWLLVRACVGLVRGSEVVDLEATSVSATAGGTAATPGAVVPSIDVE
jgi:hypothetical protein